MNRRFASLGRLWVWINWSKSAAADLESWEAAHRARIEEILRKKGIAG